MATRDEYAHWCMRLADGDDSVLDDLYAALYEDGYIDEGGAVIEDDE